MCTSAGITMFSPESSVFILVPFQRHVLQHLWPGDVVYKMICLRFGTSAVACIRAWSMHHLEKLGSKSSVLLCWSHSQKYIDSGALYAMFQLDYTP